jgi:hypothetical protein
MKRLILGLLLLVGVGTQATKAQDNPATTTKTTTVTYWYYPAYNVYYNENAGEYWYYDEPTIKWMYSKELPSTYVIADNATKYRVMYPGMDVWKDNKKHKVKYKVRKDGSIKQ